MVVARIQYEDRFLDSIRAECGNNVRGLLKGLPMRARNAVKRHLDIDGLVAITLRLVFPGVTPSGCPLDVGRKS